MALSASTIWEVETGGSDTANGGGFDPSQTAGMFTDGAATSATTSAPVFTSASYNFVAGDVGAWVYIASGTNWTPGWYKIASVAANAATLDGTIGQAVLSAQVPSTVVGCATTGSPTGATWTIDYSQQASARFSYTDLASAGAGLTVSSAASPFAKQHVGNALIIASGTNFNAGVYVIASVAAGVATVVGPGNITSGAGSSGVGGLGGAFASPGKAAGVKVAGNDVWIQTGTYTLTTTSANVSGGRVDENTGGADQANVSFWECYSTVRGDRAAFATMQVPASSVTGITVFDLNASHIQLLGLIVDGAGKTSIRGISISTSYSRVLMCQGNNCTNFGLYLADSQNQSYFYRCSATLCSTAAAAIYVGTYRAIECEAYANTVPGFQSSANSICINCISSGNSGASTDGFVQASVGAFYHGCVSYGNGRAGFDATGNAGFGSLWENCIAEANGDEGWRTDGVKAGAILSHCAGYNNTSGNYSTTNILARNVISFVANTTGSFFTNPGSGDFSLNNTANQGALARGTGYPGLMPRGTTTGYRDIGTAQHQDSGGGGGLAANPLRGFIG